MLCTVLVPIAMLSISSNSRRLTQWNHVLPSDAQTTPSTLDDQLDPSFVDFGILTTIWLVTIT